MSTREFDAGSAYLQILPSLRGFADDLKAKLAAIKTGYQVEVTPAVDPAGRAKVAAELADLPAVKVDADLSGVDAKVAELRTRLADLRDKTVALEIDPDEALAEVAAIQAEIDSLSNATAKLDLDTAGATAKVGKVAAEVKAIGDEKVVVQVEASLDPGSAERVRSEIEAEPPARSRVIPEQMGPPAVQYSGPLKPRQAPNETKPPGALDDAWRSQVQSSLKAIAADATLIPVVPDTQGYRSALDLQLAYASRELEQDIPVRPADADAYRLEMEGLVEHVSETVKAKIRVEIDPESVAALEAEAKAAADAASKGASTGSKGRGGGVGMAGLIAGGIGLGAGPIGGAAALAAPVALAAIGIAVEKSDAQVGQAFRSMTTEAQKTLREGFAPFIPALTGLANEAKKDIAGIKPDLQAAASATAPLITTLGQGVLKAAQDGIGGAASIIGKLQPEAQAVATGLDQIVHGLGGFFSGINADHATEGLTLLFTDVEQILPAVARLLDEVMPLGNALLQVLGPAVVNTVNGLSALDPVISAAAAVIRFLEPDIAVLGPLFAAGATATKLLTGSWLDFAGAATKLKSLIQSVPSVIETLGQKLGYTSEASAKATKATLDQANTLAQLRKEAADDAAAQALDAASTEKTAAARLAASEAAAEATVATKAAAEAEVALAEATDAATFSFAPLGIALGGLALLALPFIGNLGSSSQAAAKLTGELGNLEQAASSSTALQKVFESDPNAKAQLDLLQKYGITLQDLSSANDGNANSLQKVADASKQALDVTNGQVAADQKNVDSIKNKIMQNAHVSLELRKLNGEQKAATDKLNTDTAARDQANQTYADAKTRLDAYNAAQVKAGDVTGVSAETQAAATSVANALGISVKQVEQAWQGYAGATTFAMAGTEQITDGLLTQKLAVDKAMNTVTDYFKNADEAATQAGHSLDDANHSYSQSVQAVDDANHSYKQSIMAVADAQHGEEQATLAVANARQAVVLAERGVTDALANVVIAQNNVVKAEVADEQAQRNLNAARQTAIEQLKTMHLQLADQATSEVSARLALVDQIRASAGLGVTTGNAAAIDKQPITISNEVQVKAANDLLRAEQSLADALNTGKNLRTQVAAADKAGVENAPGVVSAKNALASANDGVTSANAALVKAEQAVSDAQANVQKASQGVTDALYNEGKATQAVTDAQYAEVKAHQAVSDAEYARGKAHDAVTAAQLSLTKAQDAASRSLDMATAAGQRNMAMIQQLHQTLSTNEPTIQGYNDLVNKTADTFHWSKQQAFDFLQQIGMIKPNYAFTMTGVVDTDLSALTRSWSQVLARGVRASNGVQVPMADGGHVRGPGGPRDDVIPILGSNNEFMQPADAVDHYGLPFMEAVRTKRLPKFADGGLLRGDLAGIGISAAGGAYQSGADALRVMGFPAPPSLPQYVAPSPAAAGGGINLAGISGSNEAIVQQVFDQMFGWGHGSEWNATVPLIMMESGFRNTVKNPTSTALGIFQFLDSTWAGTGIAKTTDPTQQSIAGARYIHDRYGDPLGALAHEQAYHWYDQGGWLPPGLSVVANGTGAPEAVFTKAQWDILAQGLGGRGQDLAGLEISGRLAFDQDGAARLVDGRIERALHAVGSAINSGTR